MHNHTADPLELIQMSSHKVPSIFIYISVFDGCSSPFWPPIFPLSLMIKYILSLCLLDFHEGASGGQSAGVYYARLASLWWLQQRRTPQPTRVLHSFPYVFSAPSLFFLFFILKTFVFKIQKMESHWTTCCENHSNHTQSILQWGLLCRIVGFSTTFIYNYKRAWTISAPY